MMEYEISKTLSALHSEKEQLFSDAEQISAEMQKLHDEYFLKISSLSTKQSVILTKMVAIDETMGKLIDVNCGTNLYSSKGKL